MSKESIMIEPQKTEAFQSDKKRIKWEVITWDRSLVTGRDSKSKEVESIKWIFRQIDNISVDSNFSITSVITSSVES